MSERFGVIRNPYPPAGEPTGHPHMETNIEDPIVKAIDSFERDRVSQVLLIEGTQGVGKTNLLNYFQRELQSLHTSEDGDQHHPLLSRSGVDLRWHFAQSLPRI